MHRIDCLGFLIASVALISGLGCAPQENFLGKTDPVEFEKFMDGLPYPLAGTSWKLAEMSCVTSEGARLSAIPYAGPYTAPEEIILQMGSNNNEGSFNLIHPNHDGTGTPCIHERPITLIQRSVEKSKKIAFHGTSTLAQCDLSGQDTFISVVFLRNKPEFQMEMKRDDLLLESNHPTLCQQNSSSGVLRIRFVSIR